MRNLRLTHRCWMFSWYWHIYSHWYQLDLNLDWCLHLRNARNFLYPQDLHLMEYVFQQGIHSSCSLEDELAMIKKSWALTWICSCVVFLHLHKTTWSTWNFYFYSFHISMHLDRCRQPVVGIKLEYRAPLGFILHCSAGCMGEQRCRENLTIRIQQSCCLIWINIGLSLIDYSIQSPVWVAIMLNEI